MTVLFAWIGMLGFFSAGGAYLVTGYEHFQDTSLIMLILWCGAGIIGINERRHSR